MQGTDGDGDSAQNKITVLWNELMTELFPRSNNDDDAKIKAPVAANEIQASLTAVLQDAGLLANWEWKEWAQIGTSTINSDFLILQKLEIELPYPTDEQTKYVFRQDDFSDAIMTWFDNLLNGYEMTLMAVSPLDEDQNFTIVSTANVVKIKQLLKQLGIQTRIASKYR